MTYCSVVTVLALVRLTKKRFDHYAILKILSLRSPSLHVLFDIQGVPKIFPTFKYIFRSTKSTKINEVLSETL